MKKSCHICSKELNVKYILDSIRVQHCWRPHFNNKDHAMHFKNEDFFTCIPCGKQLAVWNHTTNKKKLLLIKTREYFGKSPRLDIAPKPEIEHCVLCHQETPYNDSDDIAFRHFYLRSIGQCCGSCYKAAMNCSTSSDDDYLDDYLDDYYEGSHY